MRESIFFSGLRAFCIAFFSIIGICIGFFVLLLLIGSLFNTDTSSISEPSRTYKTEIVANAEEQRQVLGSDTPVILKLNIDGVIGLEELSTKSIRRQLVESREGVLKNNRVKALLLYVNSPGGSALDSDGIYHAIKAYKEQYKVPVYAYVDGLCASGGMYVAAAADKIYASDVSVIGSVGVLMPSFFNVTKLINNIGIESLTLTAGKDKDELNPVRPWKTNEGESIQQLLNYLYAKFVDVVVASRPTVNREKLINDYGARIFDAPQAQRYGFIDESGLSISDTLKLLLKELNIKDNNYQVMQMTHETWLTELLKSQSSLFTGQIVHKLELPAELQLRNQFLYLYNPGM